MAAISALSVTAQALGGELGPKELEVLVAELETRLRSTILRIIRPTLDQTKELSSRLDLLAEQVAGHAPLMFITKQLREELEHQGDFAKVLMEQLNARDEQSRSFERNAMHNIKQLHNSINELGDKHGDTVAELQKLTREHSRSNTAMGEIQASLDDETSRVWEGILSSNKKIETCRQEFLDHAKEQQRQREDLLEDLFGDDKGLTKLRQDFTALSRFVERVPDMEQYLEEVIRHTADLEQRQTECTEYCASSKQTFIDFEKFTEKRLAVMKDEFRQEANRLVAHHASLLKQIRNDYSDEVGLFAKLRAEVSDFQLSTDKFCRDVAQMIERESQRTDALHSVLGTNMDEIRKNRRKDRLTIEAEIHGVRRDMAANQEVSHTTSVSIEYLSRILALVLETSRISNALEMQDFVDRCAERWLSVPDDLGKRPQPSTTVEAFEQQQHEHQRHAQHPHQHDWWSTSDLVQIDWRTGLASGEYLPGQVSYGGSVFERKELLLLHHRMLTKAHAAFQLGPKRELTSIHGFTAAASGCMQPAQPCANGCASSAQQPSSRKSAKSAKTCSTVDEDPEDPKFSAESSLRGSRGSGRQRPGSQGQPQAMGSRGSMCGSLGETEPPPGWHSLAGPAGRPTPTPVPLRLPSLNCDGTGDLGASGARTSEATSGALNPKALTAR